MMRQRWLRIGWVGLVVVLALFVVACAGGDATVEEPTAGTASDGRALLEDRCVGCHGLDRTTGASKSAAEWQETVERMVSKGAELSTAEVETLVAYLAETYGP